MTHHWGSPRSLARALAAVSAATLLATGLVACADDGRGPMHDSDAAGSAGMSDADQRSDQGDDADGASDDDNDETADNVAADDPRATAESPEAEPVIPELLALDRAANPNPRAMEHLPAGFDLQTHRGGRGEWTEESLRAMENSLALGVSTLEFDVVITKDGVPLVWHDPAIEAEKCSDTAPATPNDPQFPYVGKLVHDLTAEQIATLECAKQLENFPAAEVIEGNRIATLGQMLDATRGAEGVHYNIETKIEGEKRGDSAEPEEFVNAILDEVDRAGVTDRVMIQSFDWRSLPLVAERNDSIPLVLLWDETTWKKDSPWTGEVNYDVVNGDIIAAAQQMGVQVLSPGHSVPYGRTPSDSDYNPVANRDLINRAHEAGFAVVPWTVNEEETMNEQIDAGVDGMITDYPTRLRAVMEDRGMALPAPHPREA